MALKDWKQTSPKNNKDFIEFEKGGKWVQISKGINYWYVSYPGFRKPIKTKSSAIAFAKRYMRSH